MAEVNIDVAKEGSVQAVNTTVQGVHTKVGTSGDTASNTPTTLFAGIKGLISWFTGTWTAARAAKIDTLETLWTSTRASYIDTICAYVTGALYTNTLRGSVKSIQRGLVTSIDGTCDISISDINPAKSFVLIDNSINNQTLTYVYVLTSLKSSSLTMSNSLNVSNTGSSFKCSWQVIEFY
ncbi:MAG: hypothetical protein AB7E42_08680 [Anaerotignaceae bacterium]